MSDTPFTTREIREYFNDLRMDVREIKTQVQYTNGRVSRLENWRWFITGGIAVLTILVIPIAIYILNHWPQH